jgi:hypothetical protein
MDLVLSNHAADVGAIPPSDLDSSSVHQTWYLGIDFGTTHLSAVLFDQTHQKLYPIYWVLQPQAESGSIRSFRLPTIAYFAPEQVIQPETLHSPASVGFNALTLASEHQTLAIQAVEAAQATNLSGVLLANFKSCLRIGILPSFPLVSERDIALQWSDQQQLPLSWVQQALQALLATLAPDRVQTATASSALNSYPLIQAEGLAPEKLQTALSDLKGVVLGYPVNWSDTYSFNLREAVLGAGLVAQPDQIIFVEDAIAALLSELPQAKGEAALLPPVFWQHRTVNGVPIGGQEATWRGGTLVVDAGATKTDLALVNLGTHQQNLSYTDFSLRSLAYAGLAIDQDIICQLLYPQWTSAADRSHPFFKAASYLFHPSLTLPLPADPDLRTRHRFQQRLEGSPLGRNLLEAARHLKKILQQQEQFVFELDHQRWTVQRQELESKIYVPYIQRLNRELNALLSYTGLSTPAIQQVVCTGGTGSLPVLIQWLKQKLPNAAIVQDAYTEQAAPSRTALGLAIVPLYTPVLDLSRQQYSDYFLLREVLRTVPNEALPLGRIMQLLEQQGINTRACQFRILALLEGHLPPGLVPSQNDAALLTNEARQDPDYRAITATAPFIKHGNQTYQPNVEQCDRLRQYLEQRLQGAYQQLEEPLIVDLGIPISTKN